MEGTEGRIGRQMKERERGFGGDWRFTALKYFLSQKRDLLTDGVVTVLVNDRDSKTILMFIFCYFILKRNQYYTVLFMYEISNVYKKL